jgi:hypothetical protein
MRAAIFCLLATACAGGHSATTSPRTLPAIDVERYSQSRLASPELCEQAVANYEKEMFLSTSTPVREKELFDRTAAGLEHRHRVDRCTMSFSERKAACYAAAPSLQYVENCQLYAELQ